MENAVVVENADDSPAPDTREALRRLVDAYRARCLWFLRPDYYPQSREEIERTLDSIARHGDRCAFQQVAALRQALRQGGSWR